MAAELFLLAGFYPQEYILMQQILKQIFFCRFLRRWIQVISAYPAFLWLDMPP